MNTMPTDAEFLAKTFYGLDLDIFDYSGHDHSYAERRGIEVVDNKLAVEVFVQDVYIGSHHDIADTDVAASIEDRLEILRDIDKTINFTEMSIVKNVEWDEDYGCEGKSTVKYYFKPIAHTDLTAFVFMEYSKKAAKGLLN